MHSGHVEISPRQQNYSVSSLNWRKDVGRCIYHCACIIKLVYCRKKKENLSKVSNVAHGPLVFRYVLYYKY